MIEFQIQLTELPEGKGVKVHYVTPPAPEATKAEIALAQKMLKKLQFFLKTKEAKIELPPEQRIATCNCHDLGGPDGPHVARGLHSVGCERRTHAFGEIITAARRIVLPGSQDRN